MKKLALLIIAVCFSNCLMSQQPKWTVKTPKADNSTFYYQVAKGYGRTIDEAKEKMYIDIKNNIAEKLGLTSTINMSSSSQMSSGGEMNLNVESNIDGSIQFSIPMRRVCEQIIRIEDGTHVSYGLYQVAQTGNVKANFADFSNCYKINSNLDGFWRSAIIPGWGQIYKGQNAKGIVFLGSEAALVGTAFYFHNEFQTDFKKSQETTNIEIQKAYRDKADNNATYRNVAIIGAVSVYIWNLVDALSDNSGRESDNLSKNFIFEIDHKNNTPFVGYTFRF